MGDSPSFLADYSQCDLGSVNSLHLSEHVPHPHAPSKGKLRITALESGCEKLILNE